MPISSVNFPGYVPPAAVPRDAANERPEAAPVAPSQPALREDSYTHHQASDQQSSPLRYRKPKLSAEFVESLKEHSAQLLSSLAEKMVRAQSRRCGDPSQPATDLAALVRAMGLGADAGIGDIQTLADGLRLDIDVSAMSPHQIASAMGIGTTPESAAAAISEDGMWGVGAVSGRLLDMAVRLSGGDLSKISVLRDAVTKGFEAVGALDSLPQICQDTYAETMARFDYWAEQGTLEGYGS